MENGPFIGDFPIKTSIDKGFSRRPCLITRGYIEYSSIWCVFPLSTISFRWFRSHKPTTKPFPTQIFNSWMKTSYPLPNKKYGVVTTYLDSGPSLACHTLLEQVTRPNTFGLHEERQSTPPPSVQWRIQYPLVMANIAIEHCHRNN